MVDACHAAKDTTGIIANIAWAMAKRRFCVGLPLPDVCGGLGFVLVSLSVAVAVLTDPSGSVVPAKSDSTQRVRT